MSGENNSRVLVAADSLETRIAEVRRHSNQIDFDFSGTDSSLYDAIIVTCDEQLRKSRDETNGNTPIILVGKRQEEYPDFVTTEDNLWQVVNTAVNAKRSYDALLKTVPGTEKLRDERQSFDWKWTEASRNSHFSGVPNKTASIENQLSNVYINWDNDAGEKLGKLLVYDAEQKGRRVLRGVNYVARIIGNNPDIIGFKDHVEISEALVENGRVAMELGIPSFAVKGCKHYGSSSLVLQKSSPGVSCKDLLKSGENQQVMFDVYENIFANCLVPWTNYWLEHRQGKELSDDDFKRSYLSRFADLVKRLNPDMDPREFWNTSSGKILSGRINELDFKNRVRFCDIKAGNTHILTEDGIDFDKRVSDWKNTYRIDDLDVRLCHPLEIFFQLAISWNLPYENIVNYANIFTDRFGIDKNEIPVLGAFRAGRKLYHAIRRSEKDRFGYLASVMNQFYGADFVQGIPGLAGLVESAKQVQ